MKGYKAFIKLLGTKVIDKNDYALIYALANKPYLTKGDKLLLSMLLDPCVEARFDKEWAAHEEQLQSAPNFTYGVWCQKRKEVRAEARESVLGHFGLKI